TEGLTRPEFIIHDQDTLSITHGIYPPAVTLKSGYLETGNEITKVALPSFSRRTSRWPPCSSIIFCAIDGPTSIKLLCSILNGSNNCCSSVSDSLQPIPVIVIRMNLARSSD